LSIAVSAADISLGSMVGTPAQAFGICSIFYKNRTNSKRKNSNRQTSTAVFRKYPHTFSVCGYLHGTLQKKLVKK